jgi:hypothetical protein
MMVYRAIGNGVNRALRRHGPGGIPSGQKMGWVLDYER